MARTNRSIHSYLNICVLSSTIRNPILHIIARLSADAVMWVGQQPTTPVLMMPTEIPTRSDSRNIQCVSRNIERRNLFPQGFSFSLDLPVFHVKIWAEQRLSARRTVQSQLVALTG